MNNWKEIAKQIVPEEFNEFISNSLDGRRPDSVEFADIATDVMRRDLTINALFYDLDTNEVVDLVGGIEDLKNGIVRTVGDAGERFDEDQLRVLRAIRFAGRFGSNVDADIDKVLSGGVDMSNISGERIRDEFIKGIRTSKSTKHFLGLLDKYNLFKAVFPNINVTDNFVESNDSDVVIASLLPPTNVEKALNGLKYSREETNNIQFLINTRWFSPTQIMVAAKKRKTTSLRDVQIMTFAKLNGLDVKLIQALLSFNLTVSGDKVMRDFGLKGAAVGEKIKELEINNFRASLQ